MLDKLKSVYCSLYEQNIPGAEEDYLEDYERDYSPDSIGLNDMSEEPEVESALRRLVGELVDDTGDDDLVREWLEESGASPELIASCW